MSENLEYFLKLFSLKQYTEDILYYSSIYK